MNQVLSSYQPKYRIGSNVFLVFRSLGVGKTDSPDTQYLISKLVYITYHFPNTNGPYGTILLLM